VSMTRRKKFRILATIAAAGLALALAAPATAQTIHTEVAHKTSANPTGGKPIASTAGCDSVLSSSAKNLGSACWKANGDTWYVIDTAADGADIEVHAIGNWGSPTTGFLCADKSSSSAGWTTCNDWSSIIPEGGHSVHWFVSAWKGGKEIAVSGGLLSPTH
jgi:hypothetical protein